MNKALRDKESGWIYPILGPEDFEGYDYNRPNAKWELVRFPSGTMFWKGNNPDFVEMINYTFWRRLQRRLRIWGIKL